ncbi:MAG: DUF3301 domain-containing protein [Pseudomonas sp.]
MRCARPGDIGGGWLARPIAGTTGRWHSARMPNLILLMIAGAAVFAFWNASRAAAERAEALGRNACRAADVQWLDQSVHAVRLRLCRLPNGWLGFERTFRFDYSHDGVDRHSGRLVLRGEELVAFTGPSMATVTPLRRERETQDP